MFTKLAVRLGRGNIFFKFSGRGSLQASRDSVTMLNLVRDDKKCHSYPAMSKQYTMTCRISSNESEGLSLFQSQNGQKERRRTLSEKLESC